MPAREIPSSVALAVVEEYAKRKKVDIREVMKRCGLDYANHYHWRSGRRKTVSVNTMDKLLCGTDQVYLWQSTYNQYYQNRLS